MIANQKISGLSHWAIGGVLLVAAALLLLSQVNFSGKARVTPVVYDNPNGSAPSVNASGVLGGVESQLSALLNGDDPAPPPLNQVLPLAPQPKNLLDYKALTANILKVAPGEVTMQNSNADDTSLSRKSEEVVATLALGLSSMFTVNVDDAGVKRIFGPGGWFDCDRLTLDAYDGSEYERDFWTATPTETRQIMVDRCGGTNNVR